MQAEQERSLWRSSKEAYVQQWASFAWDDDDDDDDEPKDINIQR